MLESFGRGLKMIGASIKMLWLDKRLLLPSILAVFSNIFFGIFLVWLALDRMRQGTTATPGAGQAMHHSMHYGLLHHAQGLSYPGFAGQAGASGQMSDHLDGHIGALGGQFGQMLGQAGQMAGHLTGQLGVNGSFDPGGFNAFHGLMNTDAWLTAAAIICVWWLVNRFLEGVTTALVYDNLTQGRGSGTFAEASAAVAASFPAIIVLGIVTFLAKTVARSLRNQKDKAGPLSMGFKFLANIVEIFWSLAGHLILPAIVIEGTSFWGGMKRADKMTQGNLLTIGIGEVGVDGICRATSFFVYCAGLGLFGLMQYFKLGLSHPGVIAGAAAWAGVVVLVTALSVYIRSAFYTCLYVWAIDAEAVRESERKHVRAPGPLAFALS